MDSGKRKKDNQVRRRGGYSRMNRVNTMRFSACYKGRGTCELQISDDTPDPNR